MIIFVINYTNIAQNRYMLKKIKSFIERDLIKDKTEKIIVGVSGGLDSVVLLDILNKLGYTCIVAHCNFHLRGEESNRDEQFVYELAQSLNLKFLKIDFDTYKYAKEQKISIEMAARELRYNWFEKMSQEHQTPYIAIAHNANDSVETVLLNLIRGTGLKGLLGISVQNDKVIRPLINTFRDELEVYAENNNIKYIVDSTNLEDDYARNKIRNLVLPILSEINPATIQNIHHSTTILSDNWGIYTETIENIKQNVIQESDEEILIDIEKIQKLKYRNSILFELLRTYNFNSSSVADINKAIENNQSGKIFYSPTHTLLRDRDVLIINKNSENDESKTFIISPKDEEIAEPIHLSFRFLKKGSNFNYSTDKNKIHLDADKLNTQLQIRKWKEGDYFYPLGMKGRKKLSDYFIDSKINSFEKKNIYLLLSDDDIVWIIGRQIDNRYKISNKTQNIVEITYFK